MTAQLARGRSEGDAPLSPLAVGICARCASVRHPVPARCPACGGEVRSRIVPRGRLRSWTVVNQAPPGFTAPYTIGWVQLDDAGIGVMGRLSPASQCRVHFDAPVSVREEVVNGCPARLWLAIEDE